MKVSTLRFLLYLIIAFVAMPMSSSSVNINASYAYYSLMLAMTLFFMKKDSIWFRFWIPDFKSGVLKGFLFFPVFFFVGFLINAMFPVSLQVQSDVDVHSLSLFLLIVVVAPVVEEIMFRGYIQEYFRGRLSAEWTVLVSALVFSFFHPFDLFPQVFVSGVFLSYLRESSGSILPGIVIHFLNNLVGYLSALFAG